MLLDILFKFMLNSIDLSFTYRNTLRFLLFNKIGFIFNSFQIPSLTKSVIFFFLNNLTNLQENCIYNYYFFFKFFFGFKAYFCGFSVVKGFLTTQYSFKIQIILRKKDVFGLLHFFSNDIIPALDFFYLFDHNFNKNLTFCYTLEDLNIFVEKKTSLGLFYLKHPLNFKFYFSGVDTSSCKLLLCVLKF